MPKSDRICGLIFILIIYFISICSAEIFVNQLGYRINDPKFVFFNQAADSFGIYDAVNHSLAFKDCLQLYQLNDHATRCIYQIPSTATGDFWGVMARAARIYQPLDSVFSNQCLNAAELARDYLTIHPNIVPIGGFSNPPGIATGVYGDSDDRDERIWAAAELNLTTDYSEYHNLNKNSMSK